MYLYCTLLQCVLGILYVYMYVCLHVCCVIGIVICDYIAMTVHVCVAMNFIRRSNKNKSQQVAT